MLGHKLLQRLSQDHQVTGTVRASQAPLALSSFSIVPEVRAENLDSLLRAFSVARPEAVVNCIGLIKQLKPSRQDLVEINSAFPHRLLSLCQATGSRLVHLSTDCVFSGNSGGYDEQSQPDPVDDYGASKLLGEVQSGGLTLRTSIVGRELSGASGLVEWLYSQRGKQIRGFRKAIYTGLTTLEMSRVIVDVLVNQTALEGVWQVSSDPIDKFDLLCRINEAAGLDIGIEPDDAFFCDRSLDSRRFREATSYQPPSWQTMIEEMVDDGKSYERV